MTTLAKWTVTRDGPVTAIDMHEWDGLTAEEIMTWFKLLHERMTAAPIPRRVNRRSELLGSAANPSQQRWRGRLMQAQPEWQRPDLNAVLRSLADMEISKGYLYDAMFGGPIPLRFSPTVAK